MLIVITLPAYSNDFRYIIKRVAQLFSSLSHTLANAHCNHP
nr:MAG TPA: hypothetical protein [Caudoviricetes sp.]